MFSDAVTKPLRTRPAFAPTHPADGPLFLIYITLIWIGMLVGFGREIARHIANNDPPYPMILHVHSAVFVTWLVAFTAQILLVREGKPALHRRLGWRKPELEEEMLGCLKKGKSARKLVDTFAAHLLTSQAARLRYLLHVLVGLPGVEPGTNGL